MALLPILEAQISAAGNGGSGSPGAGAGSTRAVRLIDVGTGAGLPGLVLAIVRPHWQVSVVRAAGGRDGGRAAPPEFHACSCFDGTHARQAHHQWVPHA
jgi:hypothetical protein